jgi:hypothetical protein
MRKNFDDYKYRIQSRLTLSDVNDLEVYMHRLAEWFRTVEDKDYAYLISKNRGTKTHFDHDTRVGIMHEIARLSIFVENFDSIVGGRGSVYVMEELRGRYAYRFGNIEVLHRVTGIKKDTINSARTRGSVVRRKWKIKKYTYKELTNATRINEQKNE